MKRQIISVSSDYLPFLKSHFGSIHLRHPKRKDRDHCVGIVEFAAGDVCIVDHVIISTDLEICIELAFFQQHRPSERALMSEDQMVEILV